VVDELPTVADDPRGRGEPGKPEDSRSTPSSTTEDPTIAARPAVTQTRRGSARGTPSVAPDALPSRGTRASATSAASTPAGALDLGSMSHARLLAWALIGLCMFGLGAMLIVDTGTPTSRLLLGTTCGALVAVLGIALWLTRGQTPSMRMIGIFGQLACCSAFGVIAYWGVYSPAMSIYVLTLYVYASTVERGFAIAAYATIAGIHATLWCLIMTGVTPDLGVIRGDGLRWQDHALSFVTIHVFLIIGFVAARLSRRATLATLGKLDAAVRSVAVREALLNEARLDLEHARGGPGLFTGQLIGSFQLGDVIGRGGMGEIYAAVHVERGEPAAIKLLHRHMLGDAARVERFLREARIAGTVGSESVPRVLEASEPEAEIPYLAMELLDGHDLSELLRLHGRMPIDRVVGLLTQVGAGLAAAHAAGIVHRDLKPANLFLASTPAGPRWKILDFGISKLVSATGTLTRGGLLGTPGYMAPEQTLGEDVDHRADVFSLAVIAYRCVTGRTAFIGDEAEVLRGTRERMPSRPSLLAPIDPAVEAVLAIGLAKQPEDRFAGAVGFADAFALASRGELADALAARAVELGRRWPWA